MISYTRGEGCYVHETQRGEWELIMHELERLLIASPRSREDVRSARHSALARVYLKLFTVKHDYEVITLSLSASESVEVSNAARRLEFPYDRTKNPGDAAG